MESMKKRQIQQQQKAALAPKETREYKQYGQKKVKLSENEKKARAAITIQRWYRSRRRERESDWFLVRCLCLVCCCRRYHKPDPKAIAPTAAGHPSSASPFSSLDMGKKGGTLLSKAKKKQKEEKTKEKSEEKKKKSDEGKVEKALLLPANPDPGSAASSRAGSPEAEGLRSVAEDISDCAKDNVARDDDSTTK